MKRYWKLIQQDSRKLSDKRFYRPMFRMHLTNKEILEKLLSFSEELRQHYELYQLLLFHFQEKNSDHFFNLIEQELATVNPIFPDGIEDISKGQRQGFECSRIALFQRQTGSYQQSHQSH